MNSVIDNIGCEKKRFSLNLFDCFVILYFLHKMLPIVGYYMPSVMFIGLFGVLMLSSFDRIGRARRINVLGRMLLLMTVSLLTVLEYIATRSIMSLPVYLYGEFQVILFGFIALSYEHKDREYKKKYLFWFAIACYLITSLTTIIGNIRYPMASRFLATGDAMSVALYTSKNIGGFTFIYEIVLLAPLVIYMFKKGMVNKWFAAGFIALLGYTVVRSEYTTALLFFFLSLVLLLIPNLTTRKIYVLLGIFIILFVINVENIADLLRRLAQNSESEIFSTRFNELATLLEGGDYIDAGNAGNRAERYRRSFETLVNTNLIGRWGDKSMGSIGGHSFILDTMGQYGIIGVIALVIIYTTIYNLYIKPYKKENFYPYLFYVYLVAIVLAFLNPKTYLFVFMVVFPTFASTMKEKSIKQSEDKQ